MEAATRQSGEMDLLLAIAEINTLGRVLRRQDRLPYQGTIPLTKRFDFTSSIPFFAAQTTNRMRACTKNILRPILPIDISDRRYLWKIDPFDTDRQEVRYFVVVRINLLSD